MKKLRPIHQFHHNRLQNFAEACAELVQYINEKTANPSFLKIAEFYEKKLGIPQEVSLQEMKGYLEGSYHYQQAQFSPQLRLRHLLKSCIRHLFFLIYVLLRSRRDEKTENTELLVGQIYSMGEAEKFLPLTKFYQKTLLVFMGPLPKQDPLFISRPRYHAYDRTEVMRLIGRQFLFFIPSLFFHSLKAGVNLFPFVSRIDDLYLHNFSLFKKYRAKYYIQERHYQTSAIASFLFKRFGGKYTSCIQKNILLMGPTSMFIDIDVFFTLGIDTSQRAFDLGGKIRKVVPVGSVYQQLLYYGTDSSKNAGKSSNLENVPKYDLIYIGINTSMAKYYVDAYDQFLPDYYSSFQWLAAYARKNPHLKIGIKHHSNNKVDAEEMALIAGTQIERVPNDMNSYQLAFGSRCVLTFGSTMGYELLSHGHPTVFIDPGARSSLLPVPDYPPLKEVRAHTYEDFEQKLDQILKEQKFHYPEQWREKLCMNNSKVYETIHQWFQNN